MDQPLESTCVIVVGGAQGGFTAARQLFGEGCSAAAVPVRDWADLGRVGEGPP